MRSAPAPRPGSSGRCGRSGSSPVTRRNASTGSVPGSDPTPEAGPHGVGTGLRSVLSGSPPEVLLSSGSSVGEDTPTTVARGSAAGGRGHRGRVVAGRRRQRLPLQVLDRRVDVERTGHRRRAGGESGEAVATADQE